MHRFRAVFDPMDSDRGPKSCLVARMNDRLDANWTIIAPDTPKPPQTRRLRNAAVAAHVRGGRQFHAARRAGSDLLSHALRRSTIDPGGLNDRVRDGIGWGPPGIATSSASCMKREAGKSLTKRITDQRGLRHAWTHEHQVYRAISTGQLAPRSAYTPGLST